MFNLGDWVVVVVVVEVNVGIEKGVVVVDVVDVELWVELGSCIG